MTVLSVLRSDFPSTAAAPPPPLAQSELESAVMRSFVPGESLEEARWRNHLCRWIYGASSSPQSQRGDQQRTGVEPPGPLVAAAAAAALRRSESQRQAGVAAQRAAVNESFEEARWRCFSRTLANSD